jgi:hypothetical protein
MSSHQRTSDDREPDPQPYPAEKARGGEMVLRTRARQVIFVSGLVGAIVIAMAIELLELWR